MNVESEVINFLNNDEYLESINVKAYADIPNSRPKEFISLERVSGDNYSIILDRPTLAVQVWADTRAKASNLAYKVNDILQSLINLQGIQKVKTNSIYNFPDETGKTARYQIVLDLVTYK
jgi:hypothetical protein